jgi:hypothetical protein
MQDVGRINQRFLNALLALACLRWMVCAHAAEVPQLAYALIQATPTSTAAATQAAAEHDALAQPSHFLRWLLANSQETTLVSGTLPLRNGRAEIRQLQPVVIQSPTPNISIGPTHETTGMALTVQVQALEGKALVSARMRYTRQVGEHLVQEQGHSVTLPTLQTVLFTAAGLIAPGHKLIEFQSYGQKYLVFVLQPRD